MWDFFKNRNNNIPQVTVAMLTEIMNIDITKKCLGRGFNEDGKIKIPFDCNSFYLERFWGNDKVTIPKHVRIFALKYDALGKVIVPQNWEKEPTIIVAILDNQIEYRLGYGKDARAYATCPITIDSKITNQINEVLLRIYEVLEFNKTLEERFAHLQPSPIDTEKLIQLFQLLEITYFQKDIDKIVGIAQNPIKYYKDNYQELTKEGWIQPMPYNHLLDEMLCSKDEVIVIDWQTPAIEYLTYFQDKNISTALYQKIEKLCQQEKRFDQLFKQITAILKEEYCVINFSPKSDYYSLLLTPKSKQSPLNKLLKEFKIIHKIE